MVTSRSTCVESESVLLSQAHCVLVRTMPPGSLEQVVFRMDALARLEVAGVPVINPPKAIEAAVDKYLALSKLQFAGLPVPDTLVCQSSEQALEGYHALGGDVVIKPLFGAEGRGITRISDIELAERAFKMLQRMGMVIYLQRFIPHPGFDVRLMLIGSQVFAMRRFNANDWRTNVSRGAKTELFHPDDQMVSLARDAAQAIGAKIAGVDLICDPDCTWYVIEVNAVPGWQALARTLQVDVAREVIGYLRTVVQETGN